MHCELSIGQKMVQFERFGQLLLRNFSHVKQVFEPAGGVLNSAHTATSSPLPTARS